MKFAFSSNAFLRHNLIETIRIVSRLGYEGIEIMADVPHAFPLHLTDEDITSIRKTLADEGLSISNINAFMHNADGDTYHPSWIEKDLAMREKRIDYTLRCIDLAEKLGARNISTEPGGPLDGISPKEGLRLYREGLMAVEGTARGKGIKILIEPEPGLLVENSAQFLDLFEDLDPTVFGINFDVGHFFCVNENPSQLILSMKDYIHHFHLEDIAATRAHHHLMLGHGAIDLCKILNTIEEIGYQGFVTVELYTYEHAPEDAALGAIQYLEKWRKQNFPTDSARP
ncbi:MAG: sugar phosphate isomerase/epimerase [Deltaproteobacteria bacterium]|nr:sugar phosphate isomerase/epimerase [Deltaproteobacteria bacterium]